MSRRKAMKGVIPKSTGDFIVCKALQEKEKKAEIFVPKSLQEEAEAGGQVPRVITYIPPGLEADPTFELEVGDIVHLRFDLFIGQIKIEQEDGSEIIYHQPSRFQIMFWYKNPEAEETETKKLILE